MGNRFVGLCSGMALCAVPVLAGAQSFAVHEKGIEQINAASKIAPSSVDGVFGDQISTFNGSGSFSNVDTSVPGNNALPVELRRTLVIDDRSRGNGMHLGGFAEWEIDLPRLSGVFLSDRGWKRGGNANQRCSNAGPPDAPTSMMPEDFWDGYQLHIPGQIDEPLLMLPSNKLPVPATGTYPWVTKSLWRVSCQAGTANGYGGESFIAHAPDGTKYFLNWGIVKGHASITNPARGITGQREAIHMLVSRVEDRFGNWVNYTYSGDKLTGISSNDGRSITLGYTGNLITSVTSNAGTWTYSYIGNGAKLSQVTLPDGSKWTYASTGALGITPLGWTPPIEDPAGCLEPLDSPTGNYTLSVTAPTGATAQYVFNVMQHYRSNVPEYCNVVSSGYWYRMIPSSNWALTIASKTVTGPGLPTMTWTYDIGQPNWLDGEDFKITSVSGPDNTYTRYTYGAGFGTNEGQLLKTENGSGPSAILRTQTNTYISTAEAATQDFPATVGTNPRGYSDTMQTYLRPLKQRVIAQDGVNFNWNVNACGSKFCLDAFGRTTGVTKANNSPQPYSKTEQTEFYDDVNSWILGQVSRGLVNGQEVQKAVFGWKALPVQVYKFGELEATVTYDDTSTVASGSLGTLKTVKDANNNVTTAASWKRGIPQSITFADNTSKQFVVNDAGWVTSATDEASAKTCYTHDAMGRVASITYPSETQPDVCNDSAWNITYQSFGVAATPAGGLPAGHWRQIVATDNARQVTYFDALWRPVITETYDAGNVASTLTQSVTRYDSSSHAVFQSYPQRTQDSSVTNTWANPAVPVHASTKGSYSTYDALGRVTSVKQDNELAAPNNQSVTLTQYQNGFKTQVTNPRGQNTLTSYQAFDQPTYDFPAGIQHPGDAATEIYRNEFSNIYALRRTNLARSESVWRRYVYYSNQRLCKVIEPETGSTLYLYDNVGNLRYSAQGLNLPDPNSCNIEPGRPAVARTYDARNRLLTLRFPDTRGDQDWTYTANGLPFTITTNNGPGSGSAVMNVYNYNKRNMLTAESITQPSWYSWGIGYGYSRNGALSTNTYPTGLVISYYPNALGQSTQVLDQAGQAYASGVQYYPNGGIKQFTYGNGIVHTMTQNVRQLPARVTDSGGVLDYDTRFDANGNVSDIFDYANGSDYNRHMQYDGLDRLTAAGSWGFGGDAWHRFTYDVFDNIKSWKLAGVKDYANYTYDSNNRLISIQNTAGATVVGLDYDVQGNLFNKNGQQYNFDLGNRLRSVGGESYRYDGQGRRITVSDATGYTLPMYGQSGQLMYVGDYRRNVGEENIYLSGSLLAVREYDIAAATTRTLYQHTDALGSPVAVTNSTGVVLKRNFYEPYGAVVGQPNYQGVGYAGHVQDAATGLTYIQQRYYDSKLGRFLSVDPITAYESKGANFNRYWYGNNNPYRFLDPDGRLAVPNEKPEVQAVLTQKTSEGSESTLMGAIASDAAEVVSSQENIERAAEKVGEKISDDVGGKLTMVADILKCAAKCAFDEVVGEDSDDAMVNVGTEVATKVADEKLANLPAGVKALGVLKGFDKVSTAASTLMCTQGCSYQSGREER